MIAVTAAIALGAVATWYLIQTRSEPDIEYRYVEISRGDIESTVSATGALSALRTVQVGTQVSGQITEIRADFNQRVRKGQLIARIDTTVLKQAEREAEASLERSRSERDQRNFELKQMTALWEQRVISETEFRNAEFAARTAAASVASAESQVSRARQNLGYAFIYAPVNGIVIERNVDVGQTVAASFSAPQLFLIAEDLSSMQILASVAESDIGRITEGLEARFTVQAFPERTFTGLVRQVRLQSTSKENVVNYTAVVEVKNTDGVLLPGMTATVSFLVKSARGVLRVSNAALRFRPGAAQLAQAIRDTTRQPTAREGNATKGTTSGELWMREPDGRLRSLRARVGLTDGQYTQVEGAGIAQGVQVIAAMIGGTATTGASSSGSATTLLRGTQQGARGGGPPPP